LVAHGGVQDRERQRGSVTTIFVVLDVTGKDNPYHEERGRELPAVTSGASIA
jgi:hypothetical protein